MKARAVTATLSTSNTSSGNVLADPRLWRDLAHTVRRRIDQVEVEDVVQATLEEALTAKALPAAADGVRRFVFAIARQKVADVYRLRDRERRRALKECADDPAPPPDDLRRWVERTLPKAPSAQQTFDWMLREADGETLAEIAANDRVSALVVRQRVSRLRRWLRARWAKEVAALAVVALFLFGLSMLRGGAQTIRRDESVASTHASPAPPPPSSEPEPEPEPVPPVGMVSREPRAPLALPPARPTPRPTPSASPSATVTSQRWEPSIPAVDVRSCATPTSPRGIGHITLAIRADGSIESAVVDGGDLVGRPEARCVERLYERLQLWKLASVRSRDVTAHGSAYFSFGTQSPAPWVEPFAAPAVP